MPTTVTKRVVFLNNADWPDQTPIFAAMIPLAQDSQVYLSESATYFDVNGDFITQAFSVTILSTDDSAVLAALNALIVSLSIPLADIMTFAHDVSYGLS